MVDKKEDKKEFLSLFNNEYINMHTVQTQHKVRELYKQIKRKKLTKLLTRDCDETT